MFNVRIWTWHKHTMISLVIQQDMKKKIFIFICVLEILWNISVATSCKAFQHGHFGEYFLVFVKHKWIKTIIDQYTFFRVSLNLRKWGKCYIFEWIIYSDLGSLVANKTGYLSCALNILRCKVIPKKAFLKVLYIRFYL